MITLKDVKSLKSSPNLNHFVQLKIVCYTAFLCPDKQPLSATYAFVLPETKSFKGRPAKELPVNSKVY